MGAYACRCWLLGLLTWGLTWAVVQPGWAAPAATALSRFEQGTAAFREGRFEAALAAFQASQQLEASPNTRFMIARCQQALGRIGSAYSAYRKALAESEDRIRATADPRYAATRDAARARLAELEPTVPRLTLVVEGEVPPGFYLTIDDVLLPAAGLGLPIELDAGEHHIVGLGPRVRRIERSIRLSLGQREQISLSLHRIETALIQLMFHNRPAGAQLSLDGQALAPDLADHPQYVEVGEHRVEAKAPGFRSLWWQERLTAGGVVRLPLHFLPRVSLRRTPRWLFFATASVSLALLGAGIGIGAGAQAADAAQRQLPPLTRDPAIRQDIQGQATLTNVFVGIGGGLGAAAVVLSFTTAWQGSIPAQFQLRAPTGLAAPVPIAPRQESP